MQHRENRWPVTCLSVLQRSSAPSPWKANFCYRLSEHLVSLQMIQLSERIVMGRKRTAFKKEQVGFVRSYIEKKLITRNWPSYETRQAALDDFRQRPIVGRYAHDELTRWCYRWLSDMQWHCLKNTMNSWRHRQKVTENPKRIQLSPDAWQIVSTLAEMEKKNISSFIVDRLEVEYRMVVEGRS